ncbi:NUDIX hydrolase [Sphaerotilus hippei]|nr:NUDIX domain-containing protein [Sphaerotilus hippei]
MPADAGRIRDLLHAARAHDPTSRQPLFLLDRGRPVPVGSVAHRHRAPVLHWAGWSGLGARCSVHDGGLLLDAGAQADVRQALLARLAADLRRQGLIEGWRDELFPVQALDALPTHAGGPPALTRIERASARFWGTLTFGAHCNGYVADADARPVALWIGERAADKAVDPGRLDNLIGAGVPDGQTPAQALLREAWEEAGLHPAQLQRVRTGSVLELLRDRPEGLQREHLHVHDLELPAGLQPVNQDGEVARFHLLPIAEALEAARDGRMTVDAALATLDFAQRHRLLDAAGLCAEDLEGLDALRWQPPRP